MDVTQPTTADLFAESEQVKQELAAAQSTIARLERRLAETNPAALEYVGDERQTVYSDLNYVHRLYLVKHPRPGLLTVLLGCVQTYHVDSTHDITLYHPAAAENAHVQAEVADRCLKLAVTHGLSTCVVTHSDHFFDRLRLRVSECGLFENYIVVKHYAHDYTGQISETTIKLPDYSSWPPMYGMLPVQHEVAIGDNTLDAAQQGEVMTDDTTQAVKPKVICPCCGSEETSLSEAIREYTPPFGETVQYTVGVITCATCSEGVSDQSYNDSIHAAIYAADCASVRSILDAMDKAGVHVTFIARTLGIPSSVVAAWRDGTSKPTQAEIALVRIVRTYPWVLGVAAMCYTKEAALEALRAALQAYAPKQQDMPADYAELVNDNFWDLI